MREREKNLMKSHEYWVEKYREWVKGKSSIEEGNEKSEDGMRVT